MNQWDVTIVVLVVVLEHVQEDVWVVKVHAREVVRVYVEVIVPILVLAVVLVHVLAVVLVHVEVVIIGNYY